MSRRLIPLWLLALTLLARTASAQDQGYFSDGEKQLTYRDAGSRSKNEKIALASVFGAGMLASAVGTYFLLDSQTLSDEVSASGLHTGKAWSRTLETKRTDANQSATLATVSFGLGGALILAGAVVYIITEPDDEVGYQDWQTRSFVLPTSHGLVAGQAWTF